MSFMRLLALFLLLAAVTIQAAVAQGPPHTIAWDDNLLIVHGKDIPGGTLETWYLEAFCRKGSTNRKWDETVIPHTTRLISTNDDKTRIELESKVDGGVVLTHTICAHDDNVTFDLTVTNTSDKAVDIEWAQPCARVGGFTGKGQDDYIEKCFIFTESGATMLDTTRRTDDAIYKGGQVYVRRGINRDDVNPRPLSPDVPVYNLIGCVSADGKWLFATAWDQTQELFQGIITCIHADIRIGGLRPGETKRVHGVAYFLPNDFDVLLKRYQADFADR